MSDTRREEIRAAAGEIFNDLLDDLILTTTIAAHKEIVRGRQPCVVCGTQCRLHQPLLPSGSAAGPSTYAAPDRTAGYTSGPEKGTGGATGIGSGSGKMDSSGNVFFECLVCRRQVTSNRYAPHLSSCLGLNGSTRRGARTAAAKARLGNNERSSSPYYQPSEADSEESVGTKKSSASKRANAAANGSANGSKRGRSPNKPSPSGKKKLGSAVGSGTATPTGFSRPAPGPSRLGQPPQQAGDSSPMSSASPQKSVISVPGSMGSSAAVSGTAQVPAVVDSDEEMDDY